MKSLRYTLALLLALTMLLSIMPPEVLAHPVEQTVAKEESSLFASLENLSFSGENLNSSDVSFPAEPVSAPGEDLLPSEDLLPFEEVSPIAPVPIVGEEERVEPILSIPQHDAGKGEMDAIYQVLDAPALKAYLQEQFAACNTSIDLSGWNIHKDNLQKVFDLYYYDMPEAFHLDTTEGGFLGYSSPGTGLLTKLKVRYECSASEYAARLSAVRQKANEMLAGIRGNTALTDVQKALLLHDRLALQVEYDLQYTNHHAVATIYSCLINGKAVCQGYAMTYGYLMDQIGIENYYVSSTALNHAWNMVTIDGKPYFVDVTWDDPTNDITGRVNHNNFLVSTQALRAEPSAHNAYDFEALPTDTTYDNAFWKRSRAAFQLLGKEIYYVDSDNAVLSRWSDHASLKSLATRWPTTGNAYYPSNYTRLAVCGNELLYTQPEGVWAWDPSTGSDTQIYAYPSNQEGFRLYGFKYEDNALVLEPYSSPNFLQTTKATYQFRVPYSASPTVTVSWGDANGDDSIDGQDIIKLKQYLAAFDYTSGTSNVTTAPGADANGDGTMDGQDIILLKQYLAAFDYKTGTSSVRLGPG